MNAKRLTLGVTSIGLLLFGLAGIAGAQGFDYIARPPYVQVSPNTVIPNGLPYCGTTSGLTLICYAPNFIRTAYNFPSDLDGTGQTILIVDAYGSPTIQSDLILFDTIFNIPPPPSFAIFCPEGCPPYNANDKLHGEAGWSIETSLDVEYAHAMAPGANIVLVVAASSSGDAINVAEAKAIAKYPGSIMSQSFGVGEFGIHGNNVEVMQAHKNYIAAQAAGITVLASAGDDGAANAFMLGLKTIIGNVANASFPSSDPLVLAAGGTEGNPYQAIGTGSFSCSANTICSTGLVTVRGPCDSVSLNDCTPVGYGGEQVWNEPDFAPGSTTGGAPSLLFGIPSYQDGLGLASRTTPDVSYNAAINGGVLVVNSAVLGEPAFFIVGGTSAASPQWAAIVALANQSAGQSLGFLNPAIYKLAQSAAYANDFHDIQTGNNVMAGTSVGFTAASGWDDASGWGTPNVANLVPDLVACATTATCP
ncbi:MAG TPA: S53 family peptidase [Verrucomicrobiae bacterium]|nr:S53 family peptidase [Verrucomicrobiae bacterium]